MLVHQLYATLSRESLSDLKQVIATSPVTLNFGPLEILASESPIEGVDIEGAIVATTAGLTTQFDEQTQSSPLIMLLNSPELDQMHIDLADSGMRSVWPYAFVPYIRLSQDSIPRRRHITSFINSISDTLYRNPLTLTFDSFYINAGNYNSPPFVNYFMDFKGYMR